MYKVVKHFTEPVVDPETKEEYERESYTLSSKRRVSWDIKEQKWKDRYNREYTQVHIDGKQEKLGAVFYARVSTTEEEQLKALPKQVEECKDVIASKGWKLVDGYVDEGKSGTKTDGRKAYKKLLEDMQQDKFEIVVVKSQDRLQRNTFDWYRFTDLLNKNGKQLFLYIDNKFYEPSEDALITGIKAILAEEYSRDLSKKLNNANKRRIEKAKAGEAVSAMGNSQMYGYRIIDGKWVIEPDEAKVVKKMYGRTVLY